MADNQTPVTPDTSVPSQVAPSTPASTPPEPKPSMGASSVSMGNRQDAASQQQPSGSQEQRYRELRDDEAPPDQEEQQFTLSSKALKERLGRAKKSVMKELLGVEDEHQARQLVEKFKLLEKEQEKRRLAEMSERDRERERRKKIEHEYKEFKRQTHEREVHAAVNEVENVVTGIAKDVVRDKSVRHAIRDFQEFVNKMSEEEADAFYNPESIRAWFREYAKDYEVGKQRDPVDAPLNVGAESKEKKAPSAPPSGALNLSTKGGLSKKQVNEYLKKLGFSTRI